MNVERILASGLIENQDQLKFHKRILTGDNTGGIMRLLLKYLNENITIKNVLFAKGFTESMYLNEMAKMILKEYLASNKI